MTGGDAGQPPASKGCTCSLPTQRHMLAALHTFRHTGKSTAGARGILGLQSLRSAQTKADGQGARTDADPL